MADLTSLIERIEAATEGSRELDGDIALLVGWEPTHERSSNLKWAYTYPSCRERWKGDRRPFDNWNVPRYSTSIDAALTLLPDGLDWLVRTGERSNGYWPYGHVFNGDKYGLGEAEAATPCLALLAAILRARQTEVHNG